MFTITSSKRKIAEENADSESRYKTRPEVSEADPGNKKVTQSKVSKLRPAHRNSEVNM